MFLELISPVFFGIWLFIDYYKTFSNTEKIRRIKTLSKGESEKYHLSLALSIEGQLYIMDEPLAAIDLIRN